MAKKPARKTSLRKPAKAKSTRKAATPKRATNRTPTEHRVAIASVAVKVRYGRGRAEVFELRGTAMLNAGSVDKVVRTTGLVRMITNGRNGLSYNPASLNRNLTLTLAVDKGDLALLREIFVTGTGSEMSDPALIVWATTASEVAPDTASEADVVEHGYSLDFEPGTPLGPR